MLCKRAVYVFIAQKSIVVLSMSKTSGPLTLGETLKVMRENAGLTFEALAEKTKIQRKYLERLEHEELHALPPAVYVRGFIRSWAYACDSPSEEALLYFDRAHTLMNHLRKPSVVGAPPRYSFVITSKHLFVAIAAIIIVGGGIFLAFKRVHYGVDPRVTLSQPQQLETVIQNQNITVSGNAFNVHHLTVSGQQVYIAKDGGFTQSVALNNGINTISIQAQGDNGKSIEVMRKVVRVE